MSELITFTLWLILVMSLYGGMLYLVYWNWKREQRERTMICDNIRKRKITFTRDIMDDLFNEEEH